MTTPALKPVFADGTARCGWCKTPAQDNPCNAPATWHIAWTIAPDDADCSFTCEPHMAATQRLFAVADRHRVDADCAMPGGHWLPGDPSRCGFTADDEATAGQREVSA